MLMKIWHFGIWINLIVSLIQLQSVSSEIVSIFYDPRFFTGQFFESRSSVIFYSSSRWMKLVAQKKIDGANIYENVEELF